MVVFSDITCEIIRLRQYNSSQSQDRGDNKVDRPYYRNRNLMDSNMTWVQQKENMYRWHYMTVRFSKHYNFLHYYKLLLNYMLRMVKTDEFLKNNFVFHIVPVVIKHIDTNYYIVVRIRINTNITIKYSDAISYVVNGFNNSYSISNDLVMVNDTDMMNAEYFRNLYDCEFVHKRNTVSLRKDVEPKRASSGNGIVRVDDQEFYALASLTKSPPMPPMPKTLDIGYQSAYQSLLLQQGLPNINYYTSIPYVSTHPLYPYLNYIY